VVILPNNTYALESAGSAAISGVPGVTLTGRVACNETRRARRSTNGHCRRGNGDARFGAGVSRIAADAAELMVNGQLIAAHL